MANLKGRKVIVLVLLFFFLLMGRTYALELSDIPFLLDWNCLDFRVIGLCVNPFGITGVVVMYWEPALLIETVKRPGDSVIGSLIPVISGLTKDIAGNLSSQVTSLAVPVSSGSISSNISQTAL